MDQELKTDGSIYVGSTVTLDGKPAIILGSKRQFGTVATLPNGPSYEFSWNTIGRILDRGGDFKS